MTLPYRKAVGVMLLSRTGQVLVAKRIDMVSEAWQMPQGGIDEGEEPLETARRELKEEIGTGKAELIAEAPNWLEYDLPPDLVPKVLGGKYRGQRQKWFLMRFTGTDADIDLKTEHPEFSEWKWVEPSEVPRIIVPFKRELYEKIVEIFAPFF